MKQFRQQAKKVINLAFDIFEEGVEYLILPEQARGIFLRHKPLLLMLEKILANSDSVTPHHMNIIIEGMKAENRFLNLREWLPRFEALSAVDQQSHFLKYYMVFYFFDVLSIVSRDYGQTVFLTNLRQTIDKLIPLFERDIMDKIRHPEAFRLIKKESSEYMLRLLSEGLRRNFENDKNDEGGIITTERLMRGVSKIYEIINLENTSEEEQKEKREILTRIAMVKILRDSLLNDIGTDFLEQIESHLEAARLLFKEAFDRFMKNNDDSDQFKRFILKRISDLKAVSAYRQATHLPTVKDYLELSSVEQFLALVMRQTHLKGSAFKKLPLEILIKIIEAYISKELPACFFSEIQNFIVKTKSIAEATREILDKEEPSRSFMKLK